MAEQIEPYVIEIERWDDFGDDEKALREVKLKDMPNNMTYKFEPLKITPNNLKIILTCIKIDSSYRVSFDENNYKSSAYAIKHFDFDKLARYKELDDNSQRDVEEGIANICRLIDKENATHLSVSSMGERDSDGKKIKNGDKSNNNKGVEIMTNYIVNNLQDLLDKLKNDELSGECIVDSMARCVQDVNNNDNVLSKFSFASKFCTYVARYKFNDENKDKFSICDSVMCSILPYYMDKYLDEEDKANYKDCIVAKYDYKNSISDRAKHPENYGYDFSKCGYGWYRDIIGKVIDGIEREINFRISRKDFDLILWYYYKGDSDLLEAANLYLVNKYNK
ncbi:MAG: hypothetical protein K2J16_01520 [Clostridia bacterium]|nr:hypothetical protein [Clostridia bacterium]